MRPTVDDIKAVLVEYHQQPELLELWARWLHENYHAEATHLVMQMERPAPLRAVVFQQTVWRLSHYYGLMP